VLDELPGTFRTSYPLSQVAFYAGWYDTHVSGPFAEPVVEFMPGAVAYHLHSFSAATLRHTNQHWVGPLVARGATATLGSVAEPYLEGTPDIGLCLARLLTAGFTWGEAALAADRLVSWQTTVVGDPLYRPFRIGAVERAKDLAGRRHRKLEWAVALLSNRKARFKKDAAAAALELEKEPMIRFSPILQEKLGDFYEEAGQHEKAAAAFQRAIALINSPQQRKRLLWRCAESQQQAGKTAEAYTLYRRYAELVPQPSEPALLYERLASLASALGETDEARKWSAARDKLGAASSSRGSN
jgi:tetratricopeptide (TPR) repeat protein